MRAHEDERGDAVGERSQSFEVFFAHAEPRLRRVFVATYGLERGREAAAEALAYGWEHWDRVAAMENPLGYLYRVGQSRTRRRKRPVVFSRAADSEVWVEPKLADAVAQLTQRQRVAVVLVYAFGWELREVADLTGVKVTTVQNHLERGLKRLRAALSDGDDHG